MGGGGLKSLSSPPVQKSKPHICTIALLDMDTFLLRGACSSWVCVALVADSKANASKHQFDAYHKSVLLSNHWLPHYIQVGKPHLAAEGRGEDGQAGEEATAVST